MKKIYDDENEIIEFFQSLQSLEILLLPENNDEIESICLSVHDKDCWLKWIDSSRKDAPPPDFYCEELRLMMDVMRVDDHGRIGENGKSIINPTLQRESEVMRDLKNRGILDKFPNVPIHLRVETGLPTDEDHNYIFYRDSFLRTVKSHIDKIKKYQLNHPGFKTVFFIFDESSFYFESAHDNIRKSKGAIIQGAFHLWFFDKAFINIFTDSPVDYVIWFSPYKHCKVFDENGKNIAFPKAVVYDAKTFLNYGREYNIKRMVSSEL